MLPLHRQVARPSTPPLSAKTLGPRPSTRYFLSGWLRSCVRHLDARRCSGDDGHRRYPTTRLARAGAFDASRRRVSLRSSRCHRRNTALRCSGDDHRRDVAAGLARAEAVDASGRVSLRSTSRHQRNAPGRSHDRRRHHSPEKRSGRGHRRDTSSSGWLRPCVGHRIQMPGVAPAKTTIDATPQRGSLGPKPSTQATVVFRSGRRAALDATPPFAQAEL